MPKRNAHQPKMPGRVTNASTTKRAPAEGTPDVAQEAAADEVEAPQDPSALLERLQVELEDAIAARQRALADFANFQRRAVENEHRAAETGAARVVRSMLGVLDHLDLALDQDAEQTTVEQLLGGVRITQCELVKALESQGVQRIEPVVGEEFDPNRHEAVMRQLAEGIAPNHIVSVLQPGYAMGDQVLRPAKVAVAAPHDEEE